MKVQSDTQQERFLIQVISGNTVNGLIRGNFKEVVEDEHKTIKYDEYSFSVETDGQHEKYVNDHFEEIFAQAETENIRKDIIR